MLAMLAFGGLWLNIGGVLLTLVLSWICVAVGTAPDEHFKKEWRRAHPYKSYEPLSPRVVWTLWVTGISLAAWPVVWAGAALCLAVAAFWVFGNWVFSATDKAQEIPARRRELKKRAKEAADAWWEGKLDDLEKEYADFKKEAQS